jgi:hypothetical protein
LRRFVPYCVILLAAVVITVTLVRREAPQKLLGSGREQVVAAQTLRLVDGNEREFGSLLLTPDGRISLTTADAEGSELFEVVELPDADGFKAASWVDIYGQVGVSYDHKYRPSFLRVLLENPGLGFHSYLPDGTDRTIWRKEPERSFLNAAMERARKMVASPTFEHTIVSEVPSEDLRLVTREGTVFAVLGLTRSAEPTLALLRYDGSLLAVMTLSEEGEFAAGKPKEWPNIKLFDEQGRTVVTVEFGPSVNPSLHIYEKTDANSADVGIYTLDPTGSKEIPVVNPFSQTEGAVTWLQQKVAPTPAPLRLVDERGTTLWRYRPPTQ